MGLVPKAGEQTRLIFHLSYDFKSGRKSINHHIPHSKCTVKYRDLDYAVRQCLDLLSKTNSGNQEIWFGVSDLKSTFRVIALLKKCWMLLVMKVKDPNSGEWCYFVDKCLPFGASISCALFQRFSNALVHIAEFLLIGKPLHAITNYLDDFLKIALSQ